MMPHIIDARGKPCPTPVILAKQAITGGADLFTILVDNSTAVENLKRLAGNQGYTAHVNEREGGVFALDFARTGAPLPEAEAAPIVCSAPGGDWAVFVGRDIVGDGDRELGTNLMRMFFYTLTQSGGRPGAVLFMNAGVKLPTLDEQVAEHLATLQAQGTQVLVCGTCLNFYGLTDQLKVGTVSNMYDIVSRMQSAGKVISL